MAKVFLRHVLAAKFILSTHFPEEVGLDLGRQLFGVGQELFERRFKTLHHRVCLDLAALPANGFDLQRRTDIGHDMPYFKAAVFFVKHVHEQCHSVNTEYTRGDKRERNYTGRVMHNRRREEFHV